MGTFRAGSTLLLLLSALLAGGAQGGRPASPADDEKVIDGGLRLFYGGTFYTGGRQEEGGPDPLELSDRSVEALLVRDGRILALGGFAELNESDDARGAERIDMGGAHCYPGFQDSHGYLEDHGASLENVDLLGAASFAEAVERVRQFAGSLPEGEWVLGRGWDQTLWEGSDYPTHEALSRAVPTHPVFVLRIDGQVGLANERAMVAAGIEDEERRVSGIFAGAALAEIERVIPAPTPSVRARRILRAQDDLLRFGVTAVHDMSIDRGAVEVLSELRDAGKLKLRVVGYLSSLKLAESLGAERIRALADRHDVFSIVGVTYALDGGFGSRGAALLQPYADAPDESGQLAWSTQDLSTSVEATARLGLQPTVRATGDRGVRAALEGFHQAAQRYDGFRVYSPRIEHLQLVAEQDLRRLGDLGVVASIQPAHLLADLAWIQARLGEQRAQSAYAWRTLQSRATQLIAFGSAFPTSSPDPRLGLYAAIARQTAEGKPENGFFASERLSASAAVAAYTEGAAAAALQDDRRGRLALGYAADFTAFDIDIGRLAPATADQILRANVIATVINGQVAYRRP
ncbi:N-substituted formamide deformylase precursor [Planctomycetes bacterium Poly30]|uniref:N-substituted formamide deformylase n=1 Tax=Saltatorellus ferox TaxID=2528018 RepID=A0A518ETP1_9BACT|nr:N-substituted formamide deformylase precursor [Planctomycetes bacterium Poly30]